MITIRHILKMVLYVFLLAIITCSAVYIFIIRPPYIDSTITLKIEPGQGARSIANELQREGLVRSSVVAQSLIVIMGGTRSIQAGIYMFKEPLDVFGVVGQLVNGDLGYIPVRLVVPEGTNSKKLAEVIAMKFPNTDATSTELLTRAQEGYLFPDTYFFAPFIDVTKIIDKMSVTFKEKIKPYQGQIQASGKSLEDIIKVASILEEEVRTVEDKKKVADIIWRRIANGMPLQVDSTLSYVLHKTSEELTSADLKMDDPYNSYTHLGLPPTPISNPGLESILAALSPTPNKYLFYLSDKDGITHFAQTYADHLKNKQKYIK